MTALFPELAAALCAALPDQLTRADSFEQLMAEDVRFDFPYAPAGLVRRIEGRAALTDYVRALAPGFRIDQIEVVHAHADKDGQHATVEMALKGVFNGQPYHQDYVSVLTLTDGRISHYRDYWNPLALPAMTEISA